MINRNEVLELTQKFYNNKSIYLNDNIIVIDTEESIVIDNIPNTNNDTLLFYNKDVCFKECKNIVELKDFYGCLTMEDLRKYLIEEKGFEYYDAEYHDAKILMSRKHFYPIYIDKDNCLCIAAGYYSKKTPIQIYNIINNLME